MKIALDYDDTFTADPELWKHFIVMARSRGHEIRFVTFRWEPTEGYDPKHNADIKKDAAELDIEIVFTHGFQKEHHYQADIWIDDCPEAIPSTKKLFAAYRDSRNNEEPKVSGGWAI